MNITNEIKVSIMCNAYNHERYIRSALDGFVMQKTNFAFEILIHDDASTDKTADIIREYEAKYPNLIKPIYQTENQHSKGIGAPRIFQEPRVQGKYIAFCEGDDYWTDPFKLQKQYDAMEAHPEVDICATASMDMFCDTGETRLFRCPSDHDTILSVEEVIAGGGGFVATASLFYRADLIKNPPEFRKFLYLDYTMQIYGSLRGGMLYLSDCTTVYRVGVEGSWTQRMKSDIEKSKQHVEKIKTMLSLLNQDTDKKYDDVIQKEILKIDFLTYMALSEEKEVLSKKYKPFFKALSKKQQVKIYLKACFPFLKKIKAMIRKQG